MAFPPGISKARALPEMVAGELRKNTKDFERSHGVVRGAAALRPEGTSRRAICASTFCPFQA
jgi:hypothetical protein